ncbi:hypothetical protein [Sphingopyxis sp.]|uniref:hypothetical protein n=2 Tax=Alphaproteobacteria TaxID=28211 RepID=UPI004035D3DC
MQQMIDEDGNLWNVGADGAPVFAGRAPQQQPQAAPQVGPAPFTVGTPRAPEAKAPYRFESNDGSIWEVGPDGQPRQLFQDSPAPKAGGGKPDAAKAATLQTVIDQINHIENLFNEHQKGVGLGSVMDYLPTQGNKAFDTAGAGLADLGTAAFKVPGMGPQSDADAARFVAANQPSRWDSDSQVQEKLGVLRRRVENNMKAMGLDAPKWGAQYDPEAAPSADPMQGATVLPQAAGAQADPGMGPTDVTAEGGLRFERGLSGLPDAVASMVGKGAEPSEITAFLNQQYAPYGASVGPDQAAIIGSIVQRHRANPRAPVKSLGSGWENFSMLPAQQESSMMGRAADTDVGNFAMHAANAATAGIPGYLAGDQGAAVLDASSQSRPMSSLGGDVAGSVAAMTGINAGAGALGRAGGLLTRGGGLGGDVAYGATRGGFENGPTGIVTGAAAAGLGNKIGGGIANTAGRLARGVSEPAVDYLSERGIDLTLGQLLGNRSLTGKVLNRLESAPGIGDMMAARRLESIEGFNREAMRQAVEPVGGTVTTAGREGLDQAYGAVDQGYSDALTGQQFSGNEPQFINEMGAAIQRGQQIPKLGEDFSYIMRNDVAPMFDANGTLTGDRLQAALQGLRKARSGFAGQPMGQYAGDALTDAESAITGMVGRQAPDVLPRLSAANKAYGNVSTVADAVNTAVNQGGIFTPAQLGRSAVNNTKKFGGKRAAATGNVPFRELQEAGQQVLPSTVPDSGTAGRAASLLLPAALGGTAAGGEVLNAPSSVTIPLALLAALSSKTGARVAQKALTGRGATAKKIGNALVRQKRRAGLFGAAAASSMVPQLTQ